ncbi:restriction endonuclease subunit S [Thioalkalivibrio sp. AKL19]|uniref:restriction endonuclease subunit S n=1 Tax=Thioalkalivibrio sp. AKL19 TaxID=1266914 RepID=UPI0004090977|nr:restriction endonuclease subunit S [Thioalkalivibrio sp. AKL19]
MREGWTVRPLDEVCEIKPPKREVRNRLNADDPVSFVPMNDLGIREKWLLPKDEWPLSTVAGSYTYFADGDVLLAKITPCFENGKLGIARGLTNGVGFGSSEFVVLRPSEALDAEFLFYFLSQDSFRDAGARVMSGAVGHKRVPKEFIQGVEIPLPPLPEQKRIVAILDEAFAGIATAVANTEKNLANARELFESYLDSVFVQRSGDWRLSTLGAEYDVRDGTHDSPKYTDAGRALVTSKNLRAGRLDLAKVKYISEEDYVSIAKRSAVHKGDVLLAMIGTIGNPVVVEDEPEFAIKNVALFKVGHNRSGRFLRYYLMSSHASAKMMAEAKGTTQKFVGLGYLREFPIRLPELDIETQLVEEISAIEFETGRLYQISMRKLEALEELKQSLLQKAFSGELTAGKEASDAMRQVEEIA